MKSFEEKQVLISSTAKSFFAGNYFISFLISASMNMLWTLLNSLQIICSIPLLNLRMPIHAEFISVILNDLANLKVLGMNSLNLKIFDFSKSIKIAPKSRRFSENYGTANFIHNSGILFWILLIYLFLCIPVYLGYKYSIRLWPKIIFSVMY